MPRPLESQNQHLYANFGKRHHLERVLSELLSSSQIVYQVDGSTIPLTRLENGYAVDAPSIETVFDEYLDPDNKTIVGACRTISIGVAAKLKLLNMITGWELLASTKGHFSTLVMLKGCEVPFFIDLGATQPSPTAIPIDGNEYNDEVGTGWTIENYGDGYMIYITREPDLETEARRYKIVDSPEDEVESMLFGLVNIPKLGRKFFKGSEYIEEPFEPSCESDVNIKELRDATSFAITIGVGGVPIEYFEYTRQPKAISNSSSQPNM